MLSSAAIPPTPEKPLSDKQKEAILRVFQTEIKTGQKVIMEQVLHHRGSVSLGLLEKQVVNHINYLISKQPTVDPKDLPVPTTSKVHGWLDDFDVPSTRSSGRRENWTETDTRLIQRTFKKYDTLPSAIAIKTLFQNDKDLFDILNREGWKRTYNKIKNIFKKKKIV